MKITFAKLDIIVKNHQSNLYKSTIMSINKWKKQLFEIISFKNGKNENLVQLHACELRIENEWNKLKVEWLTHAIKWNSEWTKMENGEIFKSA